MFRQIYQWIESKFAPTNLGDRSESQGLGRGEATQSNVRVLCRVQLPKSMESQSSPSPSQIPRIADPVLSSHAGTIDQIPLQRLKLFSAKRCAQLEELGILTAGQLVRADAKWIAGHFSARKKAHRSIRRYQQAIRVAASVPEMLPHHAIMLFSIHRKHLKSLAVETPSKLLRDLQRYSESTSGRKHLRGRDLPRAERIKVWIDHCSKIESFEFQQNIAG